MQNSLEIDFVVHESHLRRFGPHYDKLRKRSDLTKGSKGAFLPSGRFSIDRVAASFVGVLDAAGSLF
jgi:hypothetical protein